MSLFVFLSFAVAILTSVALIGLIWAERFHLVKPSVLFLLFFHIQVQFPSAFQAGWIEEFLGDPWAYFALAQLFPLFALPVAAVGFRNTARACFARFRSTGTVAGRQTTGTVFFLAGIAVFNVGLYLAFVPWRSTGLYAVLFEPELAFVRRQESMALLENWILKYSFILTSTVVAPVLAVLLMFRCRRRLHGWRTLRVAGGVLGIGGILTMVTLYGARGPSATIVVCLVYAAMLVRGFPIRPIRLVSLMLLVLVIPGFISLQAGGASVGSRPAVGEAIANVMDRAFGRNIVSNVWTVDYVQRFGTFGVNGIPKLAVLMGEAPVNIFNVIGVTYRPSNKTIGANSAFPFAYYACFGFAAFVPCIVLTWTLDGILLLLLGMDSRIQVAFAAATSVAVTKFTFTFYTTALLSGGFLLIPLIGILLSGTRSAFDIACRRAGYESRRLRTACLE